MKKTIATLGITGTLVFGGFVVGDLSTKSLVTTLNSPIKINDVIRLGVKAFFLFS